MFQCPKIFELNYVHKSFPRKVLWVLFWFVFPFTKVKPYFKLFPQSHRMKLVNSNNNHCTSFMWLLVLGRQRLLFPACPPSTGESQPSFSQAQKHFKTYSNFIFKTGYTQDHMPCAGQERSGEGAAASLSWAATARRYSSRCKLGGKEPVKDSESHSPDSRYAVYSRLVSTV